MFHSMSYLQRFELAKTSISVKLIIHSNKTQHDPPLTSTATDVGPEGIDYETGHGLINCHAAVKEVLRRKALR